jgi:adenylate kinase
MQRQDDEETAVRNRLVVYKKQTEPLIAFYAQRGLLANVDAALPDVSQIVAAVTKIMDGLRN